jgi:hypothetical protein
MLTEHQPHFRGFGCRQNGGMTADTGKNSLRLAELANLFQRSTRGHFAIAVSAEIRGKCRR